MVLNVMCYFFSETRCIYIHFWPDIDRMLPL